MYGFKFKYTNKIQFEKLLYNVNSRKAFGHGSITLAAYQRSQLSGPLP